MMNRWLHRFRFRANRSDLDAEMEAHLRMAAADKQANGMTAEEARRQAQREFGNLALVKDVTREMWGWLWLERLGQDVKYAFRQIRKSAAFAATVMGTLAVGIGAAAAMFTVVDHVLLRSLPFPQAGRLVAIDGASSQGKPAFGSPWLDIEQWRAQSRTLEQVAFSIEMSPRTFLQGNVSSLQIKGMRVSANFFATIGVKPQIGRSFQPQPSEFANGQNANTVMLSNAAWKEAYNGDPAILGKLVRINADPYTVIGVMPPGFKFPFDLSAPQVWAPLQLQEEDKTRTNDFWPYQVVARLRPGANINASAAELNAIQKRVAAGYTDPELGEQRSKVVLTSYANSLLKGDLKKALLALLGASGVLWLIACVNATNLLLARATVRRREIAMRGALGASRSRVVQQLVVEGLLLSGAAGFLGISLAVAAIRLSRSAIPARLNVDLSYHVNLTVLGALCGLTLLSALLSSAWPAFLAAQAPIEPALRQGGQQIGASRRQHRMGSILVIAQIAMSLTLLVACGLLLRTIYTLRHVPLGFRTDHIMVANLSIPRFRFVGQDVMTSLYQPLLERLQQLPGVQAAGLMSEVPLGQTFHTTLELRMNGKTVSASLKPVSPAIQRVFGFKMFAGRFFDEQDTATSQPVVVINRAFAQLHSPDKHDPTAILGSKLLDLRKNAQAQIVGILDDERQKSIAEPSQPEIEVCIPQITPDSGFYQPTTMAMDLALRTERTPASIVPDLRSILRQASPELADATITTMNQVVEDSYGSQTLAAHLLETFAGAALLLSIAGLYGLLSYIVSQRRHELGVRLTLGAQRAGVLWLVLRQAGLLVIAGIVIGVALALAAGRLVHSFLYGVSTHDGWTIGIVAGLLLISALTAAWQPARRAANVNPVEALRAE